MARSGAGKRDRDVPGALLRERSVVFQGPGQIAYGGRFLALCRFFDGCFRGLARRHGAAEEAYPPLIRVATLRRLGYFSSFPQLATFATHFRDGAAVGRLAVPGRRPGPGLAVPTHVLSPALCYHTYDLLRGRTLGRPAWRITAAGPCFRYEKSRSRRAPERLWSFTMREIVFFGPAAEVARVRRRLMAAVARLALATGVAGRLDVGQDAFFVGASRGKRLLQALKKLKYELRAGVDGGRTLPVASFNLHETFFGARMQIRLPEGAIAHSGCAAFGIERWAYAFLSQNGLDPARWPERVRRAVARHEAR
jgi:seryl-tRNA synthetase